MSYQNEFNASSPTKSQTSMIHQHQQLINLKSSVDCGWSCSGHKYLTSMVHHPLINSGVLAVVSAVTNTKHQWFINFNSMSTLHHMNTCDIVTGVVTFKSTHNTNGSSSFNQHWNCSCSSCDKYQTSSIYQLQQHINLTSHVYLWWCDWCCNCHKYLTSMFHQPLFN